MRKLSGEAVKRRVEWIDIAKGLGIALVSFGHLRNGDGQSVWLPELDGTIDAIYLFHMPMFFFLGGLTFSKRGGLRQFLLRKARTLLIPYYVFSLYFLAKPLAVVLVPQLRQTFQSGHDYQIGHQLVDVLVMGNGLWFLMAFFVGEVLMYGLSSLAERWGGKKILAVLGPMLIVAYALYASALQAPALPFQIDRGVQIAGFICLGVALKTRLMAISRRNASIWGMVTVVVFILLAVTEGMFESALPFGTHWIIVVFASVAGAIGFSLACAAVAHCRILAYVGRDSLVYYALNALTLNIVKVGLFRIIGINASTWPFAAQLVIGLVATMLALVILAIANAIIQRWLPWMLGKPWSQRRLK